MSRGSTSRLDEPTLERAAAALRRSCGISIAPGLTRALDEAVHASAAALSLAPLDFLRRLDAQEPASLAALIEHAVVGESYFLRHPEHFTVLLDRVLPTVSPCEPLRVWSAGCSGGEEPYSLALSLLTARRPAGASVLATDVSERALARAREGRYGEWSLRGVTPLVRARFFERLGAHWQVRPEVKSLVELERHNLVQEPPPAGGFHAVFCRNVLIYFRGEHLQRALSTLASALRPGGFLFVSPAEVPQAASLRLERVEVAGTFLFQRPLGPPRAPVEPSTPRRQAPFASPVETEAPRPVPAAHARALEAARLGRLDEVERLASEVAAKELLPEAFLLLAMTAEHRGDLEGAARAVRKALYLDSSLAAAHAALAVLCQQLGNSGEAAQSRRNALEALEGLDDEEVLRGVEATTAGGLRRALRHGADGLTRNLERE